MIRRDVAGLAVIEAHDDADAAERRWLAELDEATPGAPADVVLLPGPAARPRPAAGHRQDLPAATRDDAGRWVCRGPGHRLLAVLQDVLVTKGATLLHACAIELDGAGVVLAGPTGSGKTLAALAATTDPRIRLLSDDLVVAGSDGTASAFPTAVALRPYHHRLLPGDRRAAAGRGHRQSQVLAALARLPGGRRVGAAARDRLALLGGSPGAWARRVKTDYLAVPTRDIVPDERLVGSAGTRLVVVLAGDGPPGVQVADGEQAVAALLAATYANEGLAEAIALYGLAGHLDVAAHWRAALATVAAFVESAGGVVRVRVPRAEDPTDAQAYLLDAVTRHLPGR